MTATGDGERSTRALGSLARGGALNLVSAGAAAVSGFGLVVVVTRGLPASDAGVFFAATSVFLIASRVCTLGTPTGLVYWISQDRAVRRPVQLGRWLRIALPPVLLVSLATAVVLGLVAHRVLDSAGSPGASSALPAMAVFLPLAAVADACLAATRGLGSMVPNALVDQLGRPLLQILMVAGAIALGGEVGIAWAAPYLVTAVVAAWWLRHLAARRAEATGQARGSREGTDTPGTARSGSFWRFAAPRALAGVAQMTLQRLDIVLVAALLGPAQAALYTAATRLVVLGQLAGQALALALQPRLAVSLAQDDAAASKQLFATATSWLVLWTWPVYLSLAWLAADALSLFGPAYEAAVPVVVVLVLVMLVATACGPVDTVLIMAGRTSWNLVNVLLALTVFLAVDLTLIPSWGIIGAAIGWSAAILVNNLLPLAQVARSLRLHPLGRGTVTAMSLAAALFGVAPAVARLISEDPSWVRTAVLGAVVLYAYGCWRLRHVLELTALTALLPGRRRVAPARSPVPAGAPGGSDR